MTPNSDQPALDQLKGLHLPEAVHQLPLAPGWLLVVFCALAAVVYSCWYIYNSLKKNRYRRQSLSQLNTIFAAHQQHKSDRELLVQVNGLLKAVAINRYSTQICAGLSGSQWVGFLKQSSAKNKTIDTQIFTHLASVYAPDVTLNTEQRQQLASSASLWIKKHHDLEDKEQSRV